MPITKNIELQLPGGKQTVAAGLYTMNEYALAEREQNQREGGLLYAVASGPSGKHWLERKGSRTDAQARAVAVLQGDLPERIDLLTDPLAEVEEQEESEESDKFLSMNEVPFSYDSYNGQMHLGVTRKECLCGVASGRTPEYACGYIRFDPPLPSYHPETQIDALRHIETLRQIHAGAVGDCFVRLGATAETAVMGHKTALIGYGSVDADDLTLGDVSPKACASREVAPSLPSYLRANLEDREESQGAALRM